MSFVRPTLRFLSSKSPLNGYNLGLNLNKTQIYSNRNKKGFMITAAAMITTTTSNDENKSNIIGYQMMNLHQRKFPSSSSKTIYHNNHYQQIRNVFDLQKRHFSQNTIHRSVVSHEITKNLTLFSEKPRNVDRDKKTLKLKEQVERPLVLMFAWMLATKKNLAKYVKVYIDLGFDVLTVEITPWQLLWPTKGSQIVALDVVKFLENNPLYTPIVLHGFSVGGYVWGEVMVHMTREPERYKPITDRIIAQIWDSAADITEIPIGVPKAIFPRNQTLQKALRNYTIYHMKTFHDQATCHYIRSSQMFHSPLAKAPVLFFLSKNDPIGAEKSNLSAKESMESIGIKCTWICWDRSGHVQHFRYYREEYMKHLLSHLEANVMDRISQKSRVKM